MQPLSATATNARMFATVAEVELSRLAPMLPPPLTPRRLYGSTGGLSIQFLDIPDSTIGPYRECTLSILCKADQAWPDSGASWRSLPGFPIWIAVTSVLARLYGREVWAYPKYVGDVEFAIEGEHFRGAAVGPDQTRVECSATLPSDLEPSDVEIQESLGT